MLTERENYLQAILYGTPEYVPYTLDAVQIIGAIPNAVIEYPVEPGKDAFGVEWLVNEGGPVPANTEFLMDDITKWKEIVKIPDVDLYPWEEWAKTELAQVDRINKVAYAMVNNGIFDRLMALMGFENGLMATFEEPEACYEFFGAVADYKVKLIHKLHQYYKPDVIHYIDDLASAKGLFISPDTYRELIKPHHKRIIDAIKSQPNVIAVQHTCGRCEDIIPDYVEMGVQAWFPSQPVNDLKSIKERFKGKLALEHGLDSQGPLGVPGAPEDLIRAEVRKAVDNYAEGAGLTIFPVTYGIAVPELLAGTHPLLMVIKDELKKYGSEFYAKLK